MKKWLLLLVFILIVSSTACSSNHPNYDEEIERINDRIDSLEKNNARLSSQIDSLIGHMEEANTTSQEQESESSFDTSTEGPTDPWIEPTTSAREEPTTNMVEESTSAEQSDERQFFLSNWTSDLYPGRPLYVYYTTRMGCFYILIEDNWEVVETGNRLVLELKKDWINVVLTYEVDPTIYTGPECEKKIRSITSTFLGEGLESEYVFRENRSALFLGDRDVRGITGRNANYDDLWWMGIMDDRGAYYVHEQSTRADNAANYSQIIYESYYRMDVGALHVTMQVVSYNYKDYFNSFETTIEQNQCEREYDSIVNSRSLSWNYSLDFRKIVFCECPLNLFLGKSSIVH